MRYSCHIQLKPLNKLCFFAIIKSNKGELFDISFGKEVVEMDQNKQSEPAEKDKSNSVVKHTAKDSVFSDLFGDVNYLFQLYKALHPEDTTATVNDIVEATIKNVMTNSQYNDLGFRVGNRLLILVEAQSTWTVNIIIRILMYLMETYNQYFTEIKADLYSTVKVEMPKPEMYVVYTGDRKDVPKEINLQDEFFDGEDIAINARVKVIAANESDDIINQYITFTRVLDEQISIHGRTREAVEETIRICKDRNVLKEYLKNREKEVIDIMIALYNEQEVMDRYIASEKKESEIKATVNMYHRFDKTIAEAIDGIKTMFGLSSKTAEEKANQYWVQVQQDESSQ